ncbi:hypothetical protein SERP2093 [Staphylococcus epidermidis RP62A]|uniref:Uncharacterized protein n=1 Tax=Staphylococcus epidermidis (strain ATCC 35984 / DSM 28319 / BCRC 17069 / CCUG 31568 / BM 3577 / RP62A) TaxID=176279 RepID=Q5HL94_STAEQ|nr:hypothetical protein SERP2093 [Staphylococcus epidermidis RP62A]
MSIFVIKAVKNKEKNYKRQSFYIKKRLGQKGSR